MSVVDFKVIKLSKYEPLFEAFRELKDNEAIEVSPNGKSAKQMRQIISAYFSKLGFEHKVRFAGDKLVLRRA